MKRPYLASRASRKANLAAVGIFAALVAAQAGNWQTTADSLTRTGDAGPLWSFVAGTNFGKPHFHPLATPDGLVLTGQSPADHQWHYGLWFSWKYINKVNFWEQDKKTGIAEGRTRWEAPRFAKKDDGSAQIDMAISYDNPSGGVWLAEARTIQIGAPQADGSYTIDWTAKFTVGKQDLEFGRTPMMGEPGGAVNGGYGGFSLRLPVTTNAVTWSVADGAEPKFASGRWRPTGPALQMIMTDGAHTGAVAVLTHPGNPGGQPAPWYVVDNKPMRFFCSAILAPAVLKYTAGSTFTLRYRVIVRTSPLDAAALRTAAARFAE